MADALSDAERRPMSPFISIWWRPRQTVEDIVASRPGYMVLPLAVLGGAASAVGMLTAYGAGSELTGWRALLACVVGGGILGIVNLYFFAAVTGWVARKIGGQASAVAVRTVFAWGALPNSSGACDRPVDCRRLADTRGRRERGAAAARDVGRLCKRSMRDSGDRLDHADAVARRTVRLLAHDCGLCRRRGAAVGGARAYYKDVCVSSLQYSGWIHDPHVARGGPLLRSKYAYGYTRYSLPFSPPLFSGRIFGSDPARGDVIVFRLPKDTFNRLRQARRGSSRRSHSDEARGALYQRHGGQA